MRARTVLAGAAGALLGATAMFGGLLVLATARELAAAGDMRPLTLPDTNGGGLHLDLEALRRKTRGGDAKMPVGETVSAVLGRPDGKVRINGPRNEEG